MDNKLKGFLRRPIAVCDGIPLLSPTLNEVLDYPDFEFVSSLLTESQESILDSLAQEKGCVPWEGIHYPEAPTPFEHLLQIAAASPLSRFQLQQGLTFFTQMKADILVKEGLILFDLDSTEERAVPLNLTETNYHEFQEGIRQILGRESVAPYEDLAPVIARFKAKGRYRDYVAAKQKAKNGETGYTLKDMVVAVCCMNLSLTPLNVGEVSYSALTTLFRKALDKESYNIEVRAATSGFGSKDSKKIDDWIKK